MLGGQWGEKCDLKLGRSGGRRGVTLHDGSGGGHGQVLEEAGQGEGELLGGEDCVGRRIQRLEG